MNKSKSESHSFDESSVKNKLESSGDINITSSEGSVLIEGTDIKTEKDLNLKADKDIIVQSSKDEYNYSSKSSSSGINADLSISTDPSGILGGVTVSQNKGKGKGEGTTNVNSKFEVGGTHRAEAGETVKYEGANIEAGRVEIKGEEVIISSSKDTGTSKSENKGGSIKFTPLPSELNVNYNKGKGEKDWVSDQTSIIAKEGGIIESKDFTNSGAVIGSESEENKLIVKADNVTVEHLKDKDTNKVSGGGVNIKGTGVPDVSIITGGQDKRQDTNATAVNTEFVVKGEDKTAEELGFNTDINKAQEITKDEDRVLDVDLHTDLLNKAERDKIAEAGDYLEAIYEGITDSGVGGKNNTIKEKIYGNILKKTAEKYPGLVKLDEKVLDENGEILADKLNEKGNRTKDLLDFFALNVGYEGEIPKILIGDLPPGQEAFAAPDHNTIVIDRKVLASADSDKVLSLLAHELGHFNSYDTNTESTAKRMENTVSGAVSQKEPTAKYEENFQKKYAGKDISGSEAQKIIDGIPESSKEKIIAGITGGFSAAYGIRVGAGVTKYLVINSEDFGKSKIVLTIDKSIGFGSPDAALGGGMILLDINTPEELKGWVKSAGGSGGALGKGGLDVIINTKNVPIGMKGSVGVSLAPGEIHSQFDHSSILVTSQLNLTLSAMEKAIILENEYKKDPTNPKLIILTKELIDELEKNKKGE
nr:hemagglutinin repeat-containing protein [Fusobacterium sp. PH5-7]